MTEGEELKNKQNDAKKDTGVVPIGIKLGSQRTVVVTGDNTHVIQTCVKESENPITGEKEYVVGNEALELYGDEAIYMLRGGLPGNDEEADLLRVFLGHIIEEYGLTENSYVTYAVPSTENEAGIDLIKKVISQVPVGWAGKEIWNDSFLGASAFPEGIDMIEKTFLVINLGSSTTELVAVRKGEIILNMVTGTVCGDLVDRWIKNEIQNETRGAVNVDLTTARMYKETYANLKKWENVQESVHLFERGKFSFRIDECIIRPIIRYLDRLVDFMCLEFLPELAESHFSVYKQVLNREFILVGGMAEIEGLKERLATKLAEALGTGISIKCPENPSTASARGAYLISKYRIENKQ
jgi:hypothetical protein